MNAAIGGFLESGKVRDIYAVGEDKLLLVASDRISAFDHVLPTPIPDKGCVLTGLSVWWFAELAGLVPNHLITAEVDEFPAELRGVAELRGRSMICRRLRMVPVECVARGYLVGSGFADYQRTGAVCGHRLPPGLQDGERLPEPIFTPATKAERGQHDENVTVAELAERIGPELAGTLERLTLAVYRHAARVAETRGLILADTKFEFGLDADGRVVLADEVLTPDSSRYWPAQSWRPGQAQPSFDKQFVRDWLRHESGWDRSSPPPPLPPEVVAATRGRYVEAYERITGSRFADYLTAAG
jgi:phosphoribosylaminoimidazole-succinocarboxamide synthase